jgi:hypothetical protein
MPVYHRIMFSALGSIMFNFGSILFWALTKSILPDKTWMRILFACVSSFGFLAIGKEYLKAVDALI